VRARLTWLVVGATFGLALAGVPRLMRGPSDPSSDVPRPPARAAADGPAAQVTLRSAPVSFGYLAFPARLQGGAGPQRGASCGEADAWARQQGGEDVGLARRTLRIHASRYAQVQLKSVVARTVRTFDSSRHVLFGCEGDPSVEPAAGEARGEREIVKVPANTNEDSVEAPTFPVGDLSDPTRIDHPLDEEFNLQYITMTLAAGQTLDIPLKFELIGIRSAQATITAEYVINGIESVQEFADGSGLIVIHRYPSGMGYVAPRYTWQPAAGLRFDPGSNG